jgi:hypothetical protein
MKHIYFISLLAFISFNCEQNTPDPTPLLPTVNTAAASSITATTALSGGTVSSAGPSITARGVCWSTTTNPVVTGNHTSDGAGVGVFASPITGLTQNTVYYVRAYATNFVGTTYGNEVSFTTTASATALPTVTTTPITAITATTATGGGNVTADGGASITARGVCWATTANPVSTGNHTSNGTGTGIFISAITGLTAGTTYHVRAYATNSVGTVYGGDSVFVATPATSLPTITTTAVTAITNTTATSGGNITADGGTPVTARGVCWGTTPNPIETGSHTTDGTGIGTFTSAITGLTAATTYHVRAYATNSVGTAYGSDVSFTTTSSAPDVYVAGYDYNGTTGIAKIWKNGVGTSLTNGVNMGYANSVFVSGSDVYVAGTEYTGTTYIGEVWKNGVASILPGLSPEATSVFVAGTDVYAAGVENSTNYTATIWKNGIASSLPATPFSVANSVYVLGTDIYAAGTVSGGPIADVATLWKNSTATSLGVFPDVTYGQSVYVSGSDVYVAGYTYNGVYNTATIWKNGVATALASGTNDSYAWSVFVLGSDVYVAGNQTNGTISTAKIWKNGVATSLTNGLNEAYAYSVFVLGSDVYAAGTEFNGTKFVAKVWKNGVATALTNGSGDSEAYSVFVK